MTVREIDPEKDLEKVRALFVEYAESLGFDLCFQGFDLELEGLPGDYSPPRGRLLIAEMDGDAAGCVALRDLGDGICEMKRLYVRPEFRGAGAGRRLSEEIVRVARREGYGRMRLDTLASMESATELYRSMGFREIGPYRYNPLGDAVYMELDLGEGRSV